MNTAIAEKSAYEAGAAEKAIAEGHVSRRDHAYGKAVRKARVWSSLGQLIEAQKNGAIRREVVNSFFSAKRD